MKRLSSERLQTCYRCDSTDTYRLVTAEDEYNDAVVYCAWCRVCDAPYSYRLRVDTIHDREGRVQ